MRCEQVTPYLPGYAGGELRADTSRVVATHLSSCESCRAQAALQQRVIKGLASVRERELAPPPFLLDSILESVHDRAPRRVIPILPLPVADVARVISEHRDAIASAAGTALVAAGAAYALWRAVRSPRTTADPAVS